VKRLGWAEWKGADALDNEVRSAGDPLESESTCRYFVLKATPENNWKAFLRPGRIGTWWTAQPPKRVWRNGDRLFCWESSPGRRVVGLASLASTDAGVDAQERQLFRVRYLTRLLSRPVAIAELRESPIVGSASFLRAGACTTVQRLSFDQAEALFRIVAARNPEVASVWADLATTGTDASPLADVDETAVRAGGIRARLHLDRERDKGIIERKRRSVLNGGRCLVCEVCGFDFAEKYGERGEGFCEVHHTRPLADSGATRETRLEDLAVVCSNCHRMIHRARPWPSVAALRKVVVRVRKRIPEESR